METDQDSKTEPQVNLAQFSDTELRALHSAIETSEGSNIGDGLWAAFCSARFKLNQYVKQADKL